MVRDTLSQQILITTTGTKLWYCACSPAYDT